MTVLTVLVEGHGVLSAFLTACKRFYYQRAEAVGVDVAIQSAQHGPCQVHSLGSTLTACSNAASVLS